MLNSVESHAKADFDLAGKLAAESRIFVEENLYTSQGQDNNLSLTLEPEFYWGWHDGRDAITFKPIMRFDEHDDERQHSDIRELFWNHSGDDWEFRIGVRQVFWGVTEFRHLVDVINQTDAVEDLDGEDKLGQAMVNLSLVNDWGILDLMVLPGFREKTFIGESGRLRGARVVASDYARYESSEEEKHIDFTIRWSHSIDAFDIGLHGFQGTNRDPQLELVPNQAQQVLQPFYEQMTQVGIDLQATLGGWLWKLEVINRNTQSNDYRAGQAGFEYTFYGVAGSRVDIGFLAEYGLDQFGVERGMISKNSLSLGFRLVLNDVDGTQLLVGFDYQNESALLEISRRLGQHWRVAVDGRYFNTDDIESPLYDIRNDDHVQFIAEYFF